MRVYLSNLRLLFILVLANPLYSNAQLVEKWVVSDPYTSANQDIPTNTVLRSSDGSVIVSGYDAIKKYNSNGNQIWATDLFFPVGYLPGGFVMAGYKGDIYVTAINTNNDNTYSDDEDIYLAKYNSLGEELWSIWYDNMGLDDCSTGIALDQFGNVYLTGKTGDGTKKIVTIKFNSNGVKLWDVTYGGSESSDSRAIAVDFFTGDVFVAGSSLGPNGDDDYTVIKYNTNGEQQWIDVYDGNATFNSHDKANGLIVDSDGNVIVTGTISISLGSLDTDVYATFKFDRLTGDKIWSKGYGKEQSSGDDFYGNRAYGIAIDVDDNVIITGSSSDDFATIKYRKADGEVMWIRRYDGDLVDYATSVITDVAGNVYVTGSSSSTDYEDIVTIKYNSDGIEEGFARFINEDLSNGWWDITVDDKQNVHVTGSTSSRTLIIKYVLCSLNCPRKVEASTEPGKCGAIVNFSLNIQGDCGDVTYTHAAYGYEVLSGTFFSKGHHHIIVKSESTGEICGLTIEVNDTELPVITKCPAGVTVSCASEVPDPDITLVEATDNCNSVTIAHVSDVKTNETCANRFTLTRTYSATDASGNSTTCIQIITVYDGTPPVISGLAATPTTLWPPNHKMKDIVLNYTVTDNCNVAPVTLSIKSNEPDNGTSDGDTDQDFLVTDNYNVKLRAERASNGDGRIYEIKVTADDGCNDPVSATTPVVVAHNIKAPVSGASHKIGSTVNLEGVFWDKPGNTHTATWMVDNTIVKGIVTEPEGIKNGKVTGSYKFSTAGVYKLQMNVKDQHGVVSYANTNGDVDAIVVIYDPNGGNAYGGGWFASPKGALKSDPNATGKVSFGFASSYFKKATSPKGETQMEFKIGALEFNALNFEYLAISNARAQFKGSGRINGDRAGYDFIMTVIDGKIDGSGTDKIRLKIFSKSTGEIIYDNQPGASDADDPKTTVGVGSEIVIITGKKQGIREDQDYITEANDKFGVKLFPNPTTSSFNLLVNSLDKEDVQVKVFNATGQLIKSIKGIAGQTTSFGNELKAGMYFIEVVQGENKQTVKLIKF